jgi:electron transfer flavoprotein-quinone oxidoreductase
MAQDEKFDAIVVGAGPAGTAAAITMAKAGLQVVLLEKGQKPGSKNVMGGILYTHNLEEVVGEDWKQAPLERPIIEEQRWMMTTDAAIRLLGYKNFRARERAHSYSVLRARFDPWFSSKAEEAGAFVINETVVEELIVREGRVVGVKTGREGDLFADVVVVCEGVGLGSALLERAKLKKPLKADQVAMAVKEIMQLDPQLIESRFNCDPGEGASVECYGEATMGMAGFMFIYTNKDTLSVGGGALLSDMTPLNERDARRWAREGRRKVTPNQLLEHFKSHPAIKPLLQGAETVEYLAKMIPEAGYHGIPKVYGDGYLICGDAAGLSNPVHREGSNLAMTSGRLAGETVIRAKERRDFTERTLKEYRMRLDTSWIIPDMKKYDKAVPLLEQNPQMLGRYPQLLDRALDEFFRVDGVSKRKKQGKILRMFRKEGGARMLWDTVKAGWTMK